MKLHWYLSPLFTCVIEHDTSFLAEHAGVEYIMEISMQRVCETPWALCVCVCVCVCRGGGVGVVRERVATSFIYYLASKQEF